MGFKCFPSLPLTVACCQKTARRLPLMKCGRVIVPVCPFGPRSLGGARLPRPHHRPQAPAPGSGWDGHGDTWGLLSSGLERHPSEPYSGQGFKFSPSAPIIFTPVNRSGDPKSRAHLQKAQGVSEPRQHPCVYKWPLGRQQRGLEIWGLPLTQVQEGVQAAPLGPGAWGRPSASRWVFRASLTSLLMTRGLGL